MAIFYAVLDIKSGMSIDVKFLFQIVRLAHDEFINNRACVESMSH